MHRLDPLDAINTEKDLFLAEHYNHSKYYPHLPTSIPGSIINPLLEDVVFV